MPSKDGPEKKPAELELILAALKRDYSKMSARIRGLEHSIACDCKGVRLRLHFPSFRQGKATIYELVEALTHFITPFSLPRSEVIALDALYGKIPVDDFKLRSSQLSEKAKKLFMQANKETNRNGEAGELLLYVLTEWILAAPQLIAKMSLKTNKNMPVHGADGVHIRFSADEKRLFLYWGESKLYSNVGQAIQAAMSSIVEASKPDKLEHELHLVQRNIDFSGLDSQAKEALLRYLDPFEEAYNERYDVTTCLIGFDFDAFKQVTKTDGEKAELKFAQLAKKKLEQLANEVSKEIKAAKLDSNQIEIFFFPIPSVKGFRNSFQDKIGWKKL